MTTQEKAKRYDEALEIARKINSGEGVAAPPDWTTCEVIFPELKESEDERIRKELYAVINDLVLPNEQRERFNAWLEKQKINTEGDFGRGYDCGYKACLNSNGAEFFEKQKEQKPLKWSDEDEAHLKWLCRIIHSRTLHGELSLKEESELGKWIDKWINHEPHYEKKWSKEDEHRCGDAIYFLETAKMRYADTSEIELTIDWLKSLRPQPHTVSIKDATKFGNLEYERGVKDGIQHAKIHQWKPSEGQMKALSETIAFAPDTFKPKCTLVTLQDDLKKLKGGSK